MSRRALRAKLTTLSPLSCAPERFLPIKRQFFPVWSYLSICLLLLRNSRILLPQPLRQLDRETLIDLPLDHETKPA